MQEKRSYNVTAEIFQENQGKDNRESVDCAYCATLMMKSFPGYKDYPQAGFPSRLAKHSSQMGLRLTTLDIQVRLDCGLIWGEFLTCHPDDLYRFNGYMATSLAGNKGCEYWSRFLHGIIFYHTFRRSSQTPQPWCQLTFL